MKSKFVTTYVVFIFSFFSATLSFADFSASCFDFIAPLVPDRTTLPASTAAGTIIFDDNVGKFYGRDNSNKWQALSQNQVVILKDVKANGVDAGTFTQGAWQLRELNTLENPESFSWISLASNEFTISDPGVYLLEVRAPALQVNSHQARVISTVGDTIEIYGNTVNAASNVGVSNHSVIRGIITLTQSTTMRIEHQCDSTKATDGLGLASGFSGATEEYTNAQVTKLR